MSLTDKERAYKVDEDTTVEQALEAINRTLYEDGLQTFLGWLRQQDPVRFIDSQSPCGCFLHNYMADVYPWGVWQVGYTLLRDSTSPIQFGVNYDEEVPDWYNYFQRAAYKESRQGWLTYGEAVSIAEKMLVTTKEDWQLEYCHDTD